MTASRDAQPRQGCDAESVRIRLFIVDDSTPFLESAQKLLEREGITVVGVATNSADALQLIEKLRPDVTLVDIDLGEENGFELVERLAAVSRGGTDLILVSTHSEGDLTELIESSSALGFVPKTRLSAETIFEMLEQARAS
jgi:DNA-binding NarL/FixJ family response regulator